jgi:hypothetical protein
VSNGAMQCMTRTYFSILAYLTLGLLGRSGPWAGTHVRSVRYL